MFGQFFQSLQGRDVIVELKNNTCIKGKIQSSDRYLNIKLVEIQNDFHTKDFPQIGVIPSCVIRGSSIRYIHLPKEFVEFSKLHEATELNYERFKQESELKGVKSLGS